MAAKRKDDTAEDRGPWWVEDSKTGHRFATYRMAEGLQDTGESPFDRNGGLRTAEPRGAVDPAAEPVVVEGVAL